jgi:hypothetical protein
MEAISPALRVKRTQVVVVAELGHKMEDLGAKEVPEL